ncbi:hypothetical protein [Micromonospora sp. NBC_00421]|uniref:hypothetical protein n=1 Tax=Micromonospora sp. NBC_00421 TaxID=2975976 RepID=UPI002E1DAE8D
MTAPVVAPHPLPPVFPVPYHDPQEGVLPSAQTRRVSCPTCGGRAGSLLAGCGKPACRRADLDYDAALDARWDH